MCLTDYRLRRSLWYDCLNKGKVEGNGVYGVLAPSEDIRKLGTVRYGSIGNML